VSPMIAEPFLLNEDCSPFIDNDTSATLMAAADLRLLAPPGTIPVNDTNLPADTLIEAQQMTRVRYAFWIMAAVQVRCQSTNQSTNQYASHRSRRRRGGRGHVSPPEKKFGENIFGRSCKLRAFSGKYHVKFGNFVNFSRKNVKLCKIRAFC